MHNKHICLPLIYLMIRHPRVFGSLNFERVGRLLPFFDHIFLELSRQTLLSESRGYLRYLCTCIVFWKIFSWTGQLSDHSFLHTARLDQDTWPVLVRAGDRPKEAEKFHQFQRRCFKSNGVRTSNDICCGLRNIVPPRKLPKSFQVEVVTISN